MEKYTGFQVLHVLEMCKTFHSTLLGRMKIFDERMKHSFQSLIKRSPYKTLWGILMRKFLIYLAGETNLITANKAATILK